LGERQNAISQYQTTSYYDLAFERELRELAASKRENDKLEEWQEELRRARDPFTFIHIALKNREWRNYYNSLSNQEKNELLHSITDIIQYKILNEYQQHQARIFNEVIFPFWFYGRMMGKW
jgi:hypothetical protein